MKRTDLIRKLGITRGVSLSRLQPGFVCSIWSAGLKAGGGLESPTPQPVAPNRERQ